MSAARRLLLTRVDFDRLARAADAATARVNNRSPRSLEARERIKHARDARLRVGL